MSKGNQNDFIVTSEDEQAVADKLKEFSIPLREEPKVYQPVIFDGSEPEKKIMPIYLPREDEVEHHQVVIESKSQEEEAFYYDAKTKMLIDFSFGFVVVLAMFYYFSFEPMIIFAIYAIGMVQAVWAYKSKRLFIVWGFIFGAIASMVFALVIYGLSLK
jgi:hypothetical protein